MTAERMRRRESDVVREVREGDVGRESTPRQFEIDRGVDRIVSENRKSLEKIHRAIENSGPEEEWQRRMRERVRKDEREGKLEDPFDGTLD